MYHPTTRVLTVLEMLQSRRTISGTEIAERLEIDVRTARRYISMLEEMGVPVVADRGRLGGYRLMPGFKLPPLMLNEDEALALTLGLLAARRLGLGAQAPGVEGALAKIERVLPEKLRDRVRAVEETLVLDTGSHHAHAPDSSIILTLSAAAQERKRIILSYKRLDGAETERRFDPYGLACHGGRWYATGHCHLRKEMRLFRLDRVGTVTETQERFDRPKDFDVLAAVMTSLGSVRRDLQLEVILETSLEYARWRISARVATLENMEDGRVLLRGYTENADWMAYLLASLGCRFEIRQPQELRGAVHRLAAQMIECAEMGQKAPNPPAPFPPNLELRLEEGKGE